MGRAVGRPNTPCGAALLLESTLAVPPKPNAPVRRVCYRAGAGGLPPHAALAYRMRAGCFGEHLFVCGLFDGSRHQPFVVGPDVVDKYLITGTVHRCDNPSRHRAPTGGDRPQPSWRTGA